MKDLFLLSYTESVTIAKYLFDVSLPTNEVNPLLVAKADIISFKFDSLVNVNFSYKDDIIDSITHEFMSYFKSSMNLA